MTCSSFKEILAKEIACEKFLCNDASANNYDLANELQSDREKWNDKILVWEVFENEKPGHIVNMMKSTAHHAQATLDRYAQAIKNALIIHAIGMELDSDVTKWDLSKMATLGYNLSCEYKIKNELFKFNPNIGAYQAESGLVLPFDRETGLPNHPTLG